MGSSVKIDVQTLNLICLNWTENSVSNTFSVVGETGFDEETDI